MPELPEVETVRRGLEGRLKDRRLVSLDIEDPRLVARSPIPPDVLLGGRVLSVGRRGKWLIAAVEDLHLVLHLRMSGQLLVDAAGRLPPRATLGFDDGTKVAFVDQRRFGELLVWTDAAVAELDARLGPDADNISVRELRARLSGRTGKLKATLCNQSVVAGIGNMYADEALWRARLAWDRPAGSLDDEESRRLARSIRAVLRGALAAGGTSTRDGLYVDSDGSPGWFAVRLAAYQREGEPCRRCGVQIRRDRMGSASVYWCPNCQS